MNFKQKNSSSIARALAGHNATVPSGPLRSWDLLYSDLDLLGLPFKPMDGPPPIERWNYDRDLEYWERVRVASHVGSIVQTNNISRLPHGHEKHLWNYVFLKRLAARNLKLVPIEFINMPEGQHNMRGPTKAPHPHKGPVGSITYLDSYIVWEHDISWITFFGSD